MPRQASIGSSRTPEGIKELEFTMSSKRPLSCAECRRLKRRCDRQWPCKSCVSRGCATICPGGTLTQGVGGKFVLHGSEQLHKKIGDMSERIRHLEDALSSSWNQGGEHPLLRKELLRVKLPPDLDSLEMGLNGINENGVETKVEEAGEDLGTLHLGSEGRMAYIGRSAMSKIELLVKEQAASSSSSAPPTDDSSQETTESYLATLPDAVLHLADNCFCSPLVEQALTASDLSSYLPSVERGIELINIFYDNAAWFYSPAEDREEFIYENFSVIYGLSSNRPPPYDSDPAESAQPASTYGASDLALLYMVLSTGATVDLSQPSVNEESEVYFSLAKACMALDKPGNSCSIAFVQALHMMINHNIQYRQEPIGSELTWACTGILTRMTTTLGLHRDSAGWNLSVREVNKRRRVFWLIFVVSSWRALVFGRPPSVHLKYIDTEMPLDRGQRNPDGALITSSYERQKFGFLETCVWPIIDYTFDCHKSPSYSAVLELDQKIRAFETVELPGVSAPGTTPSVEWVLETLALHGEREFALLYIHRPYFTRALTSHPDAPLDSPYASSVLTSIKSASAILRLSRIAFSLQPGAVSRSGIVFSYLLKAAVPLTILCARSPRGSLTPHAYEQLRGLYDFFETAQKCNPRVASSLNTLRGLQNKAREAMAPDPQPTSSGTPASKSSPQDSEELPSSDEKSASSHIGNTRVVKVDIDARHPSPSTASPNRRLSEGAVYGSQQSDPYNPVTPSPLGLNSTAPDDSYSGMGASYAATHLSHHALSNHGAAQNSHYMAAGPSVRMNNGSSHAQQLPSQHQSTPFYPQQALHAPITPTGPLPSYSYPGPVEPNLPDNRMEYDVTWVEQLGLPKHHINEYSGVCRPPA